VSKRTRLAIIVAAWVVGVGAPLTIARQNQAANRVEITAIRARADHAVIPRDAVMAAAMQGDWGLAAGELGVDPGKLSLQGGARGGLCLSVRIERPLATDHAYFAIGREGELSPTEDCPN